MREAQSRCDAREFAEWVSEYQRDPWGEERADLRAAIVACTIANVHRGKKAKAYKVSEFMPRYDVQPKKTQTPAVQQSLLMGFFGRMGMTTA